MSRADRSEDIKKGLFQTKKRGVNMLIPYLQAYRVLHPLRQWQELQL